MIPARAAALLDLVAPLARRFDGSGHRLYLVGGVVRDLVVDRTDVERNDLDLTTDATPEQVKALVRPVASALWTQGERFGTIGCTIDGETYEITTHRAEAYSPDSRKPEVVFSTDIDADLSRRDFTVNAMALEVTGDEPVLIDPFGGLADLGAHVLRTPRSPEESFGDDPLRMLRAARFMATFSLRPEPELRAAVEQMAGRLEIVSAERIRDELCKLVVVPDPSDGLYFLNDTGLAEHFLPELPAMRLEQDPIHRHKDVLSHTIAVVAKSPPVLLVRLAALFHDVAKPKTRSIGPHGVSFHHHEVVGARMTRDRMRALKFSNEMVQDVSQLVYLHLRFHTYEMGWSDSAVRRFVRDAGPLLDELLALTRSDCTTRNKRKAEALDRRIDDLEARIATLAEQEELASIRPDLDGREVMEHLGMPAGPAVGEALSHLLELRLDRGPMSREDALAELDRWYAARRDDTASG
ncbi:MAG: CCA tRNA nucleotidyltransferase [Microthrixaceae bacterium]